MVAPSLAEPLDLVDEHNRVVGRVDRSKVHGQPRLAHRAVHVFVRNRRGDLYLQRRSLTKEVAPGLWDTSVGGHVDAGESYLRAACRELDEELGLQVAAEQLQLLHHYVWRTAIETEHVRTFATVHEGPFVLHPEEIDEGRFWTLPQLRGAVGGAELTPNLEHELSLLGLYD